MSLTFQPRAASRAARRADLSGQQQAADADRVARLGHLPGGPADLDPVRDERPSPAAPVLAAHRHHPGRNFLWRGAGSRSRTSRRTMSAPCASRPSRWCRRASARATRKSTSARWHSWRRTAFALSRRAARSRTRTPSRPHSCTTRCGVHRALPDAPRTLLALIAFCAPAPPGSAARLPDVPHRAARPREQLRHAPAGAVDAARRDRGRPPVRASTKAMVVHRYSC